MSRLDRSFMERQQWSTRDRLLNFAQTRGVALTLPDERLCGAKECATWLNGEFIYRDSGHLRRNLAPETYRLLSEAFGLPGLLDSLPAAERAEWIRN
jgi:hypothetical protein